MKDYSAMSDFEINKAVAFKLGLDWSGVTEENRFFYQTADYCNNPADAWPIIEKHGITLAFDGSDWWATSDACWVDGCEWQIEGEINRKPLRAAMIVYLQMMEQKK